MTEVSLQKSCLRRSGLNSDVGRVIKNLKGSEEIPK
jgi:hypothetical protein